MVQTDFAINDHDVKKRGLPRSPPHKSSEDKCRKTGSQRTERRSVVNSVFYEYYLIYIIGNISGLFRTAHNS